MQGLIHFVSLTGFQLSLWRNIRKKIKGTNGIID